MQVVILAGGLGTRLSEETHLKPKPMVELGGMPILWHIMKQYEFFGFNDFVICCGYKGYVIKEFFSNYYIHSSDIRVDLENNDISYLKSSIEKWRVTLVDTGIDTQTGGRLRRVKKYIDDDTFLMTYGDGVSDVNISELIQHHKSAGKKATVTAVRPPGRFGALNIDHESATVKSFIEKPDGDHGLINGGFFVLNKSVLDLIDDDSSVWEQEPLSILAQSNQLSAFIHNGFWQPMDTLRDKTFLEDCIEKDQAPWLLWNKPDQS